MRRSPRPESCSVLRSTEAQRVRIELRGMVQGVGFRPFVYRLGMELGLAGWVSNSTQGVTMEAEGPPQALEQFQVRLEQEKPDQAVVQKMQISALPPYGYQTFQIRDSDPAGDRTTLVSPDLAICRECLTDIFDPSGRRFQYPFTNCTNCGPRFSIIESLPYDRANTTMHCFNMCSKCRSKYKDPLDRRFHAQPNACPTCGPQLQL